jgi:O-antigen/teichoic acid export membrane protein
MWTKVKNFIGDPSGAALAKGGLVVLIFKVIGALGGYVLLFSLAQAGGELSVGVYEVAFTLVLIGSTIGRWGLDTVVVKEMSREALDGAPSRALYLAIFVRVLVMVVGVAVMAFILASLLTNLFFQNTPSEVLATAAIATIPFTMMLLNAEVFRALGKPLLFSLNQHGSVYSIMAVLLWVIPFPEGMGASDSAQIALMLLLGISALFFAVSTMYILSITRKRAEGYVPNWRGKLYKMATPMLISSSLFLVISWSDTLMLGYYLTEDRVGVYRIVFKIATLITFAQFALNTVVAPMVSALHEKGTALDELTTKVARLNLITAGPIFVGIVLFGPWLIGMFGVSTASAAYPWLVILAFGQLINAFAGPGLNILNMTGYEKSARNTMLVVVVLNVLLNLLFIPTLGPLGAAISTTATMVGWNVWAAILVYKYHGVVAVPFLTHIKK